MKTYDENGKEAAIEQMCETMLVMERKQKRNIGSKKGGGLGRSAQ